MTYYVIHACKSATYRAAEAHFGRVLPGVHAVTVDVTRIVDWLQRPVVLRIAREVTTELAEPHNFQAVTDRIDMSLL